MPPVITTLQWLQAREIYVIACRSFDERALITMILDPVQLLIRVRDLKSLHDLHICLPISRLMEPETHILMETRIQDIKEEFQWQ